MLSLFLRQKLGATVREDDLRALHELLEAGTVTPVVDRAYPLSEAPDSIRYLRDDHARCKVLITV
jgi:NADPH:quinone reductase-like Zn-dependent oxidoreductase